MVNQTGSALWLALAGGHHRVTAVISKLKIVGGQSPVVLSNHHRGARKTAWAPNFFVYRLAWVSGGWRWRSLPAMLLVLCLSSPCCGSTVEIAGTEGLYTKPCFSPRLYSLVLQVRAPESREREAQHGSYHFENDWCCDTNRRW